VREGLGTLLLSGKGEPGKENLGVSASGGGKREGRSNVIPGKCNVVKERQSFLSKGEKGVPGTLLDKKGAGGNCSPGGKGKGRKRVNLIFQGRTLLRRRSVGEKACSAKEGGRKEGAPETLAQNGDERGRKRQARRRNRSSAGGGVPGRRVNERRGKRKRGTLVFAGEKKGGGLPGLDS